MRRMILLIFSLIIILFLGWLSYSILHSPRSFTLPTNQKINNADKKMVLGTNTTDINHIVIIMMENKAYEDILGNRAAPFVNKLLHTYSYADKYIAVSHPSLPNYIALIGGSTFGISSDCTHCSIQGTNIIDQLESNHKTWKAYMDSMPSSCFVGSSGDYAQKHDPFIYFDNIRNNTKRCEDIVPLTQLQKDLQSENMTPNFIWISPNLCNDTHNCSVETGDLWLSHEVTLLLSSPAFTKEKSLLVITWDEGEDTGTNQVLTIFAGNGAKRGYISHKEYSHYSLLHTVEAVWQFPPLTRNVFDSPVMSDMLTKN